MSKWKKAFYYLPTSSLHPDVAYFQNDLYETQINHVMSFNLVILFSAYSSL